MSTSADANSGGKTTGFRATKVPRITCAKCDRSVDVGHEEAFSKVACPTCGRNMVVPVELNQFHLYGVLGKGSMGFVYRATDRTLRRQVAIKVLRSSAGDGPKRAMSCVEEARALAALNHPNVVQIYSVDKTNEDQPFIVMELVNGGRLDKMLQDEGPLDELRALQIGIDVAKGLQAAHGVGLIHGDVKPANILLDKAAVAKLVDFGIARFADGDSLVQARGTPRYVAPEVIQKKTVDHRADQFSLGATLYHILSGRFPFEGPTVVEVLRARLETPAEDLRRIRTNLHTETAAVVMRMLEIDPNARYMDYEDLLGALREAREATLAGPSQPNLFELDHARLAARRVRRRRRIRSKKSKWPVLILLTICLALSGWIGHTLWSNANQRSSLRLDRPADPSRWIRLINLVDVHQNVVAGRWSRRNHQLTGYPSEAGRLVMPFVVQDSYEAKVVLSLPEGGGGVSVILPVAGNQAMLVLGVDGGSTAGLQWIDGQRIENNVTETDVGQLKPGLRYTLKIEMAIDGSQADIKADLNDQSIIRWSGSCSSLSLIEPWSGMNAKYLGLGATTSEVQFHRVEIRRLLDEQESETQK